MRIVQFDATAFDIAEHFFRRSIQTDFFRLVSRYLDDVITYKAPAQTFRIRQFSPLLDKKIEVVILPMDKAEEIKGRHFTECIPLNEEFILPLHADAQLLIDDINLQRRPASGRCQFDYLDQLAVVVVRFKRIR